VADVSERVEVFAPVDLDACLNFGIVAFDRRDIGTALVDRDLLGRAVPLDRLAQESQRGFVIPLCGQQEIYRGTGLIDGPIQVLPAAGQSGEFRDLGPVRIGTLPKSPSCGATEEFHHRGPEAQRKSVRVCPESSCLIA
jgi:hypothetical protein